jgi:hypothetical protein
MSTSQVLGVATRVTTAEARRHFRDGGTILVSAYGHETEHPVTSNTTTHTRETTTWEELTGLVEMWRGRYPNQRYYVVERRA